MLAPWKIYGDEYTRLRNRWLRGERQPYINERGEKCDKLLDDINEVGSLYDASISYIRQ